MVCEFNIKSHVTCKTAITDFRENIMCCQLEEGSAGGYEPSAPPGRTNISDDLIRKLCTKDDLVIWIYRWWLHQFLPKMTSSIGMQMQDIFSTDRWSIIDVLSTKGDFFINFYQRWVRYLPMMSSWMPSVPNMNSSIDVIIYQRSLHQRWWKFMILVYQWSKKTSWMIAVYQRWLIGAYLLKMTSSIAARWLHQLIWCYLPNKMISSMLST